MYEKAFYQQRYEYEQTPATLQTTNCLRTQKVYQSFASMQRKKGGSISWVNGQYELAGEMHDAYYRVFGTRQNL